MKYDIIIVGGGPAGLSFAGSLANTGLRIAVLERQSLESIAAPVCDGRDIALTHLSVRILQALGVWDRLPEDAISPIREARVQNGRSAYSLNFDTHKEAIDALGYLVSNHEIRQSLFDTVKTKDNIEIITDVLVTSVSTNESGATVVLDGDRALESSLVVAADSRFSETRRMMAIAASMHDFGRVCVVCRMEHDQPHNGIAYECFHYGRTLAVLPLCGNQSSIVITAPMSEKNTILEMAEARFNMDVESRFGSKYGEMKLTTERFAYPLVGVHARKFVKTRFALIGDAAVGMHPVRAHGFNLGLSGQDILAKEIIRAVDNQGDIADSKLLHRFESKHMRSTRPRLWLA